MKTTTAYGGAIAALLLPAGGWWFLQSVYADVLLERIDEWRFGWLLAAAAAFVLIIVEVRCLGTFLHLVMALGRMEAFNAELTNPLRIARRRRRRMGMAAGASAVLVAFLVSEVVFRVFDIRPPPPPHGAVADYLAVNNTLNAWGLREPWDSLPEDDHRLRIVFLGDSIVYGDGIEREETFCYLLEGMLASSRPEGVRTINMGFWGSAPARQLDEYLRLRDVLTPDIVVQVVYPNDVGVNLRYRLNDVYRLRDADPWVGEWSYVLRYAERQIRYRMAWQRTIDYFRGGRDSAERATAWATFRRDVAACKSAVEETGAVYALVLFPWLVRLDDNVLPDVHDAMREFASQLGVPYLDLLEVFAGRDAESLRVSPANDHPNAPAHRLAAERIARFLREEVLPLRDR